MSKGRRKSGKFWFWFVVLVFTVGILGWYKSMYPIHRGVKTVPLVPAAPSANSTAILNADWNTFTSKSGRFSFKYPKDGYAAAVSDELTQIFPSLQSAQAAEMCNTKHLGTIERPCGFDALYGVWVSTTQTPPYSVQYADSAQSFSDTAGRHWLLFPIGANDGDMSAEITVNKKVWDISFTAARPNHTEFYTQILSTFVFE